MAHSLTAMSAALHAVLFTLSKEKVDNSRRCAHNKGHACRAWRMGGLAGAVDRSILDAHALLHLTLFRFVVAKLVLEWIQFLFLILHPSYGWHIDPNLW